MSLTERTLVEAYNRFTRIYQRYQAVGRSLVGTMLHLQRLEAEAAAIHDRAGRARALGQLATVRATYDRSQSDFDALTPRMQSTRIVLLDALKRHAPDWWAANAHRSGVGAIAVPVVIGAAAVAAIAGLAGLAYLVGRLQADAASTRRALDAASEVIGSVRAGELSPDEARQLLAELAEIREAGGGGGITLGLGALATPALILGGLWAWNKYGRKRGRR